MIRAPHTADLVRVTWALAGQANLHVSGVSLRHARSRGLADDVAIRRILAIRYGGGLAAADTVQLVRVEPIEPPA